MQLWWNRYGRFANLPVYLVERVMPYPVFPTFSMPGLSYLKMVLFSLDIEYKSEYLDMQSHCLNCYSFFYITLQMKACRGPYPLWNCRALVCRPLEHCGVTGSVEQCESGSVLEIICPSLSADAGCWLQPVAVECQSPLLVCLPNGMSPGHKGEFKKGWDPSLRVMWAQGWLAGQNYGSIVLFLVWSIWSNFKLL